MTNAAKTTQNQYTDYLQSQLFGPIGGEKEWLPTDDPPNKKYITGILFPRVRDKATTMPSDLEEEIGYIVADADEPDDSPLAAMLQRAPASAGLTFAVSKDAVVDVKTSAAVYISDSYPPSKKFSNENRPKGFLREPVGNRSVRLSDKNVGDSSHEIFDGRAELHVRWRKVRQMRVVTVSIINAAEMLPSEKSRPEDCLYQVRLEVSCVSGNFCEPPTPDAAFDTEESVLRLRYRNRCAWGSGHSTSVKWDAHSDGTPPDRISIDYLPSCDVHPFSAGVRKEAEFDERVLLIQELAQIESGDELRSLLEPFVADHASWIDSQRELQLDAVHNIGFSTVMGDLDVQSDRLLRGVAILCDQGDSHRITAFRLANAAMLDQMERTALREGRPFNPAEARWRPFQLAFQLLAVPGVLEPADGDGRNVLDLIWFPTGGGKTEAYLLLAAFTIIYRRLHFGVKGEGTSVLSRYTLRLLTSQQFVRTATLICALERLRRHGVIPGEDVIDIGLWIGGGEHSSPNTCKQAFKNYKQMLEETRPINRFMLIECPWCGCSIIPAKQETSHAQYGIHCTATGFNFNCPDSSCDFHNHLPVQVVDECLYANPPTILLATLDKFARLPWESRSRAFFGLGKNVRPPDLVIQDELHLISGPLGTIAAIYESAIDVLIQNGGDPPKYVAATATIRGANDQARRLYGREVRLFPASGPNADDSYYMMIDETDANSRRYVGIMGQGRTNVTSAVHTMAAMVDAGQSVTEKDDYWTLVAYHNSRRELGKTMTLSRDDIPSRIQLICTDDRRPDRRTCESVVELSGNLKSYQVPQVLSALKVVRDRDGAVDVLACTNMISVGVDVERLNAMVILGQPKMSSEYIQASSRVGRGRNIGGIVVVNFSPTKPRDRSHYENFVRFHESMYRWVEPTSVTPQSPPALDRALHASIITVLRLAVLVDNNDAVRFDRGNDTQEALFERLRVRLHKAIDLSDRTAFDLQFDEVLEWWSSEANAREILHYKSERQFAGIMRFHSGEDRQPARPTLNSMRNVDGEAATFVLSIGRKS